MYKPYGIIPPIITPFDDQGYVDCPALAQMSRFLVDNGVHGLFPFGTTGEFYAVSDGEFIKGLETVRDAVKGKANRYGKPIQLIAGCSHITTREVIRLIKLVEQVGGYDAISVLTPMFVSQTQAELYTYYKTIADSTEMPIIMYNNKPKTNVTIEPATVSRLARACPNMGTAHHPGRAGGRGPADRAGKPSDGRGAAGPLGFYRAAKGAGGVC